MIEKINIDNKKKYTLSTSSILEIIVILYCLVLFRNCLSSNLLQILNYNLEKNIINSILLSGNIKANFENINLLSKRDSGKVKDNDFEKNKKYLLALFGIPTIFNVFFKFNIITQINIISIYIIDIICYIVYCIYSKSRKKGVKILENRYSISKCNNLCVI